MADTLLDENIDELLALDPETEVLLAEDLDAEAILGDESIIEKRNVIEEKSPEPVLDSSLLPKSTEVVCTQETSTTTTSTNNLNGFDNAEEAEQLDYEEEEEDTEEKKQPRESKFISERSTSQKSDKETTRDSSDNNRNDNRKHGYQRNGQGNKYYINPNFKGSLPPTIKVNLTQGPYRPNAPQNNYNSVPPFPTTQLRPSFGVQQGVAGFGNTFHQNPVGFGVPQQPSSSFLPNGVTPINTLPTVHIRPMQQPASFVPSLLGRPNGLPGGMATAPRVLPHVTSDAVNWSLMVDAFVKKTNSEAKMKTDRRRREYSPKSSRSRSRSPASSYSGSSSYSASRSPSPVQTRKPRKVARYDQRDTRQFNSRRPERQHFPPRSRNQDRDSKPKPDKQSIECAQAIGLDEEYLKKIEQQKQAREEIAKRKNQRRRENYAGKESSGTTSSANKDVGGSRDGSSRNNASNNNNTSNERRRGNSPNQHSRNTHPRRSPIRSAKSSRDEEKRPKISAQTPGKLKAYLAVVVNNVAALPNAFKRISLLANGIGKTKKAWQASENSVNIIFEKHEDAKAFVYQYHGKSVNGHRMDVTLEKVFLNLSAMP
uniref:RRM domain-containing protein n=1 Tax=Ditylenchus dipsaci TaxID=166011 RepID=A0A915D6G3_9BILA